MADYDETNRGAAFAPFDTQKMILQGKVNDNGRDMKVIFVSDKTKDDKKLIEVYAKVGVLFDNTKKDSEGSPDYTGPFNETRRIAAWRKMKGDKPYMSLSISDNRKSEPAAAIKQTKFVDDDVPW
jgi:uncharacterized protein (DUF736 family)